MLVSTPDHPSDVFIVDPQSCKVEPRNEARRSLQAHLVISDVVMSAPMVVARFRELVPFVRVLLMSGYTEHPHLNVREIAVLAERVRGLLDAETTCAT